MAVELTSREISEKYDRLAHWYDWVEGRPIYWVSVGYGGDSWTALRGMVLEVALGTGENLPHYPPGCESLL